MLLFTFGSSVVVGINTQTVQDSWIALIVGALIACPVLLIYARILRLYPGKTLFEIMDQVLGKTVGKILCVLISWYAIHLCALVIRNFSEFMEISTMPETPQLPIMILILLVTIYLVKSGVRTMGKWAISMFGLVLGVVIFTVVLSISKADFENLLPIMEHTPSEILSSSVYIASFPFMETMLFLCMADYFGKQDNPYKMYLYSLAGGTVIFLLVILRNLTILGQALMKIEYFPSFVTARIISIGNILPRIEGSISTNFVLGGIMKIAICMIAAVKGVSHLFGIEETRRMIAPVGLLALALAATVYKSALEMFDFINYYWIYAFPFQVMIPLAVWLAAEIARRKKRRGIPNLSRGNPARDRAGPAAG